MTTSYNGWSASPNLRLRPLVVAGESFSPGIRDDDDVHEVLKYVAEQLNERVEPIWKGHPADDWGFSYRQNRNGTNLSNHASGTAIDYNATRHPNGVRAARTFTATQIAEIHQILGEVDHVVRWGGDYTGTPDSMHFEINASKAAVAKVAARLRTQEDDMPNYRDWDKKDKAALAADVVEAIMRYKPHGQNLAVEQLLKQAGNSPKVVRTEHAKDRRDEQ